MDDRPKHSPKRYVVHCDACGKNVVVSQAEDVDGFHQYRVASTPGGVPVFDATTKAIVERKSFRRRKMFRCTGCGRGIVVRPFLTPATPPGDGKGESNDEQEDLDPGREVGAPGPTVP